jgi:hypothetical protein
MDDMPIVFLCYPASVIPWRSSAGRRNDKPCEPPFAHNVCTLEVFEPQRFLHCASLLISVQCPASAPVRQIGRVEEGRISGSS